LLHIGCVCVSACGRVGPVLFLLPVTSAPSDFHWLLLPPSSFGGSLSLGCFRFYWSCFARGTSYLSSIHRAKPANVHVYFVVGRHYFPYHAPLLSAADALPACSPLTFAGCGACSSTLPSTALTMNNCTGGRHAGEQGVHPGTSILTFFALLHHS